MNAAVIGCRRFRDWFDVAEVDAALFVELGERGDLVECCDGHVGGGSEVMDVRTWM